MVDRPVSVLVLPGIWDILNIRIRHPCPSTSACSATAERASSLPTCGPTQPKALAQVVLVGEWAIGSDTAALAIGDNIFFGHFLTRCRDLTSNHSAFVEHRYDQAISTNLSTRHAAPTLHAPERGLLLVKSLALLERLAISASDMAIRALLLLATLRIGNRFNTR